MPFSTNCVWFTLVWLATTAISSSGSLNDDYLDVVLDPNHPLLGEIEVTLGEKQRQSIEKRIPKIKQALHPMFIAMQNRENQKLGRAAVRFILHRFFMQVGWSIRGLEPAGETWNIGSPTKILQHHVPKNVQTLFDEQLDGQGFGLNEVSILAATFKHAVRGEMIERLRAAYRANNIQYGSTLEKDQGQRILDTYMTSIIMGDNISAMNPPDVLRNVQSMDGAYPLWSEVRKQVQNLQLNYIRKGMLGFPNLKHMVEEIGDRIAFWNNAECLKRKHELVAIEDHDSGRVRLSEFYRISLYEGKWYFAENTEYLRQLGALDDTNPNDLRVIIPNWFNSMSNCMASSNYYSICCLNECDGILAKFENELQAANATPTKIATLIAALPSDTVPGNRTLSSSLIRRLNEIGEIYNGSIPIFGRLFAQVLHHAYPRECPFPHVSGTTKPQRTGDWETSTGSEVVATAEEMMQHIEAARSRRPHSGNEDGECAPWMEEEELIEPFLQATQTAMLEHLPIPMTWVICSCAAILVAFGSGVAKFVKSSELSTAYAGNDDVQKPVYFI